MDRKKWELGLRGSPLRRRSSPGRECDEVAPTRQVRLAGLVVVVGKGRLRDEEVAQCSREPVRHLLRVGKSAVELEINSNCGCLSKVGVFDV